MELQLSFAAAILWPLLFCELDSTPGTPGFLNKSM
jgi:hypothetical protein